MKAGHLGADGTELAADFEWRVRLRIKRRVLRLAAGHEKKNAGFGFSEGGAVVG